MKKNKTREQIIKVADLLFYRQGFEHTSFADIAGAIGISRGNFYYHFKTKDEILEAVIDFRLANTQNMLHQWEEKGDQPADRIRSFIHILLANRDMIREHGCPVGTLCSELSKLEHHSLTRANELFTLFRLWLAREFTLMGHEKDADQLAMHLLARSQGVALLANSFKDENFLRREVAALDDWLAACTPSPRSSPKKKNSE